MYKRKLGAMVPRRDILSEQFFAFCNVSNTSSSVLSSFKIRVRSARILKLEDVKQPQDLVQEIEPEEQAGDLLIDEALFEEDKDDLPNEQLRNKSVAYLL